MQISIDGKQYDATDGQTVLDVARANDIYIPTLCYHRKTGAAGRCRTCVVEIEGMRGLQTSCTVAARDGMKVVANSPAVRLAQKTNVDLLLSSGRHDCLSCQQNGDCELQEAAYRLGIERPSFPLGDEPPATDDSSEFVRFEHQKCIRCGRCVAGCTSTVVNEVLQFGYRGRNTKIVCDNDLPMGTSTCVQCGECVQLCPTAALTDKKTLGKGQAWTFEKVDTTCAYCGVGCQLTLHVDRAKNRIAGVTGREVAPNDGMLCVKGRYAYEFPSHRNRLNAPLIKKNGVQVPVSWAEALDYTASRISEIVKKHGPDTFSAFGSGRISNENNYAVMKFTRAAVKTNNVDHCARTRHAPTVAGLATSFGSGAMTNTIQEIEDAKVIFVIGSNTTEAHPIISYYIKRAVKKGAILIVNDPRTIDLTRWATMHVQQRVGTDIAYLNGLINEIFKNGWDDKTFLAGHTENPDDIRAWVKDYPIERASEICGVPVETMKRVARILGEAESASVLYTLGITEHVCGTDNVKTIANLQMVLGNLGKHGAGVNPLRGQNNVQGACDMGALPNVYQNYQPVDDPAVVKKIEKAWGVTGLPLKPGYKKPTMLRKALDGGTRALLCVGDNTVQTDPNAAHTIKQLQALEFLVVVDIFPNITTPFADVVLPDTAWAEDDGTFTNTERRVQRVRKALSPPDGARPTWWIMQELGKLLGVDLKLTSANAAWEDMRLAATSCAGITWDRIDRLGIQWPCPTLDHPGTPVLHRSGNFTRGKGLFSHTDHIPPAEQADAEYPFVLTTGRRLWHYHSGTQTRNSIGLENIFPEELIEISQEDADKLGIKSGDMVRAKSRRGEITVKAWVTRRSPPGVIWCTFHFHEAHANVLTNDAYDSVTETAEYKACAIKIEKVSDGMPFASTILRQARP